MEEVVLNPPRVILLPTVYHHPVAAEVAHIRVRFVALAGHDIDHKVGDEALRICIVFF